MDARKVRDRLHYLWFDAGTDWVELMSSALSGSFIPVLLYRGDDQVLGYAWAYAFLCACASFAKIWGVVLELSVLRIIGCVLGMFFWVSLSVAIYRSSGASVSFGCFAVLAVVQGWAWWRIQRYRTMHRASRRAV
jgi:hypothetical protein